MRLKVGAATSVGKVRPINEDAYLVSADRGLFVVCDGMGGAAAGEVASRLAIDTIGASIAEPTPGARARGGGFQPRTEILGYAIAAANDAILDRAQDDEEHAGMGTTVVGIWIADNLMSIAHVGDSRCYVRSRSGFRPLTSDHSLVEAQVQAGLLDREASLKSDYQNILLRALGREPDVEVELNEVTVSPGDLVLLCTDGLTRMVSDAQIAESLERCGGDPQAACDALVASANAAGGPDNITVLAIEVTAAAAAPAVQ